MTQDAAQDVNQDQLRAARAAAAADRITDRERVTIADLCAGSDAIRNALDTVCGTWSMMVITALTDGPQRYAELRRAVEGINDRMLSQTLQRFVTDGLAVRREAGAARNAVTYELTSLGTEVADALGAFLHTVMRLAPRVAEARGARSD